VTRGLSDSLSYVPLDEVRIDGMQANGMEILAREGRFLGDLEGFLVNLPDARVKYVVVRPKASIPRVTLAPIDGARVDLYGRQIRLGVDSLDWNPTPSEGLASVPDAALVSRLNTALRDR